MAINIDEYHGYLSKTSFWKAQRVTIGDYKLYFSYNTIIAFETPNKCYKVNDQLSHTTKGHISSAGTDWHNTQYVDSKTLQLLIYSELMKIPFEEAMKNAGVHCKRVS